MCKNKLLLWYAQSFFYKREYDGANYENALTNSLLLYPGFVWPQVELANYYKKKGNLQRSCTLFEEALANIKHVYSYDDFIDFTNLDNFIDENLKGTTLGPINYATVKDFAADCMA